MQSALLTILQVLCSCSMTVPHPLHSTRLSIPHVLVPNNNNDKNNNNRQLPHPSLNTRHQHKSLSLSLSRLYRPLPPKTPQPANTSLSPENIHSPSCPSPYLPNPSLLPLSPNSPHLINKFPSSTPLAPVPASHPPSLVVIPLIE